VVWKLENTKIEDFNLTERCILDIVKEHLTPFLFPTGEQKIDTKTYQNMSNLIIKQIALNGFISQSAHAFCFDDSVALTN
jgi:hypothetical protein